jgi:ribosome-associated toxin RatA of RatAB toxin-antitoxin module
VEQGLNQMIKDGSFDALFKKLPARWHFNEEPGAAGLIQGKTTTNKG